MEDFLQGGGIELEVLVSALASGADEACRLENVEVLRDGLASERQCVIHRQRRAELEEALVVALGETVEDASARWRGQGFIDVAHAIIIGKSLLACQGRAPGPHYHELARSLPPLPRAISGEQAPWSLPL